MKVTRFTLSTVLAVLIGIFGASTYAAETFTPARNIFDALPEEQEAVGFEDGDLPFDFGHESDFDEDPASRIN